MLLFRLLYRNNKTKCSKKKHIDHKIAVPCDLRQGPGAVRETDFKILKCITGLISTIVEQTE